MPRSLIPASSKGPTEQQVNQSQRQLDGDRTPWPTQYIPMPVAPGPPRLEQHALAIPVRVLQPPHPIPSRGRNTPFLSRLYSKEFHNDRPPTGSHVPLPHNVAGLSRGHPSFERSGISAAEDLKNLASRYLHSLDSSVDKLRMRRSRSGIVKVLILLEIDGTAVYVRVPTPHPSRTLSIYAHSTFLTTALTTAGAQRRAVLWKYQPCTF